MYVPQQQRDPSMGYTFLPLLHTSFILHTLTARLTHNACTLRHVSQTQTKNIILAIRVILILTKNFQEKCYVLRKNIVKWPLERESLWKKEKTMVLWPVTWRRREANCSTTISLARTFFFLFASVPELNKSKRVSSTVKLCTYSAARKKSSCSRASQWMKVLSMWARRISRSSLSIYLIVVLPDKNVPLSRERNRLTSEKKNLSKS